MSKKDTDIFLMSNFAKEHRRVEKELRQKMGLTDTTNICEEDLNVAHTDTADIVEDEQFLNEIAAILAKTGLDVWLKQKEQEQMEKDAKV